jgi:hypothetical protein
MMVRPCFPRRRTCRHIQDQGAIAELVKRDCWRIPPVSRFSADGGHGEKQRVVTKLGVFFERFFGLSSGGGEA